MSNHDTRMNLFDRLSGDLASLIPKEAGRYCCPICLCLFERGEADQLLTLEHVIPNGLGKRLLTLTCKTCNNDVGGAKLDVHLHRKLAIESFFRGSGDPVAVELKVGGYRVAANWERTTGDGGVKNTLRVVEKATAPRAVQGSKDAMLGFSEGDELHLSFRIASEQRASVSLLKSGYLLGFSELGYRFILHNSLDAVRQQIQRPAEVLLPAGALVVGLTSAPAANCVIEITDPTGIYGLLASLELKLRDGSTLHKGVLLPTPASPADFFDRALALRRKGGGISCTGHRLQRAST